MVIFQVSDYVSLPGLGLITARVELVSFIGWMERYRHFEQIDRQTFDIQTWISAEEDPSSGISRTDCVSSLSSIAPGFPANLLAVSCPVSAIATDSALANP